MMKTQKKLAILLFMLLILFSACSQKNNTTNNMQSNGRTNIAGFLGLSDTDLVKQKGEGEVTTYEYNGKTLVSQRKYEENLFDMLADVEYFYSDDGVVSQIVGVFRNADRKTVVETLTVAVGKAKQQQEESGELQFKYMWLKDGISYTVLNPPESSVVLIVQKDLAQ